MYQEKSTPCDLWTLFVRGLIDSIEISSHYSRFERINCQENFQIKDSFPWQITSYNRSSKPPQHSFSLFPTQCYMVSLSALTISSLWLFSNPAWPSCVHSILARLFGLLTPPGNFPSMLKDSPCPRSQLTDFADPKFLGERDSCQHSIETIIGLCDKFVNSSKFLFAAHGSSRKA